MCDLRRCDACCPLSCGHLTPLSRSAFFGMDFMSTGHRGSASDDPAARWHQPGRCIHACRQADACMQSFQFFFSPFVGTNFADYYVDTAALRPRDSGDSFSCESAPACERLEMNKMEMKMRYSFM